jgi:DNA-binding NarL/FixJ family response regulator
MSLRVLVVHGQPVMLAGLAALLRAESDIQSVMVCEDPAHIQSQCEQLQPDVLVMGLQAHSSHDLALTRELHSLDMRIVAFADQASRATVVRVLDAGAQAYVCALSSRTELIAGVRAAAAKRVYLCQSAAHAMLDSVRREALDSETPHCHLGLREEQVLRLIAHGLSSKEIARKLQISPSTVEVHRRNIMRKVGLHKVAELTRYAIRNQLVSA